MSIFNLPKCRRGNTTVLTAFLLIFTLFTTFATDIHHATAATESLRCTDPAALAEVPDFVRGESEVSLQARIGQAIHCSSQGPASDVLASLSASTVDLDEMSLSFGIE